MKYQAGRGESACAGVFGKADLKTEPDLFLRKDLNIQSRPIQENQSVPKCQ